MKIWPPRPLLQPVDWLPARQAGVQLAIWRLDAIDPLISGNKWYKLAPHVTRLQREGCPGIISLGGAHSNHLHALAAAGQRFGFATAGLLRGHAQDTPTVRDLQAFGMQLHWLGYAGYRARHQPDFAAHWLAQYPGWLFVGEGGCEAAALQSCASLWPQLQTELARIGWDDFDQLWLACGTGTTLAGLATAIARPERLIGCLAVPPDHGVRENLQQLLGEVQAAQLRLLDASLGGFARSTPQLLAGMQAFTAATGVLLEPLYTGKLLLALQAALQEGRVAAGSRVILLHSGGLQGRRAMDAAQH